MLGRLVQAFQLISRSDRHTNRVYNITAGWAWILTAASQPTVHFPKKYLAKSDVESYGGFVT